MQFAFAGGMAIAPSIVSYLVMFVVVVVVVVVVVLVGCFPIIFVYCCNLSLIPRPLSVALRVLCAIASLVRRGCGVGCVSAHPPEVCRLVRFRSSSFVLMRWQLRRVETLKLLRVISLSLSIS
jgi:hypothetical protein